VDVSLLVERAESGGGRRAAGSLRLASELLHERILLELDPDILRIMS
jgi:hypothetical protein